MNRAAILTPSFVEADAVSNDVIGEYHALTGCGYDVDIFAEHWTLTHPTISNIHQVAHFLKAREDLLIYHHSIGWPLGVDVVHAIHCRRVLRYHNITPPQFFEGLSAELAASCRLGREQTRALVQMGFDLYLFDSEYNMHELLAEGVREATSAVVPPFHRVNHLYALDADLAVLDTYRDGTVNVLTVGRLAPNKGHADLLEAFAVYHRHNPASRLLIVGKPDARLGQYTQWLEQRVAALGLRGAIVLTGGVTDRALKAYYLLADVLLMTSAHEGFCVPLVEAMAMKVPIVALGRTAIRDTVGEAGVVWDEFDPHLLAASVDCLVRDEITAAALGYRGWHRYIGRFANERVETEFLKALKRVA